MSSNQIEDNIFSNFYCRLQDFEEQTAGDYRKIRLVVGFMKTHDYRRVRQMVDWGNQRAKNVIEGVYCQYLKAAVGIVLPQYVNCDYLSWSEILRELTTEYNYDFVKDPDKAMQLLELARCIAKKDYHAFHEAFNADKPFPKINDVLCLRIWKTVDDFADFCKEYLSFMKEWDPEEYTKMKQPDSNLYQLIVRLKDQGIAGAKKLYFDFQLNII